MDSSRERMIKDLEALQAGTSKPLDLLAGGLWFWYLHREKDGSEYVTCPMPGYEYLRLNEAQFNAFRAYGGHHLVFAGLDPTQINDEKQSTTDPQDNSQNQQGNITAAVTSEPVEKPCAAITETESTEPEIEPTVISNNRRKDLSGMVSEGNHSTERLLRPLNSPYIDRVRQAFFNL